MENSYFDSEKNYRISSRPISDIKADARENLLGKYGYIIGATLVIAAVVALISSIFSGTLFAQTSILSQVIRYIAMLLVSMLSFLFEAGIYSMHLKSARHQQFEFKEFLFALKNEPNRFLISGLIMALISFICEIPMSILVTYASLYLLKTFQSFGLQIPDFGELPGTQAMTIAVICVIISLIVYIWLILGFSFVSFLLIDRPDMGAKDAFRTSWTYMKGNKRRLFLLFLSFVGLLIIGCISLIGFLWVVPYMRQALTIFYQDVIGEDTTCYYGNNENASYQDSSQYYPRNHY